MGQGENKKLIVITPSGCKEMAIEQRIKEILERELPNLKANIERDTDSEKVGVGLSGRDLPVTIVFAARSASSDCCAVNSARLKRVIFRLSLPTPPDEYEQLQAA